MENTSPQSPTLFHIKRIIKRLDILENQKILITIVFIVAVLFITQPWLIFSIYFAPAYPYIAFKMSKLIEAKWGNNQLIKLGILILYFISLLIAFALPLLVWITLLLDPIQQNNSNHGSGEKIIILIAFFFVLSILLNLTTILFSTLFYLRRKKLSLKTFIVRLFSIELLYALLLVVLYILVMNALS